MEKKSITVFNQKLAAVLMIEGFKLQGVKQDRRYPDRNVYFFENCEKVREITEKFKCRNLQISY